MFVDVCVRYEAIVTGDPELVVEYRGKIFYFETEEKLQKFMRYVYNTGFTLNKVETDHTCAYRVTTVMTSQWSISLRVQQTPSV